MALQDILEKLEKEAETAIAQLEAEFEEKKKELEKTAAAKLKEVEKNMDTLLEADTEKLREKIRMEAQMEAKNKLLTAKRALLWEILNKAVKQLHAAENYEEILVHMLKKTDLEESAEIVPAKGKEQQTKNAIHASGKKYRLSEHSANIAGGFILKTEKIEMDNSFETILLQELKQNLEIEMHKLLFS